MTIINLNSFKYEPFDTNAHLHKSFLSRNLKTLNLISVGKEEKYSKVAIIGLLIFNNVGSQ